ncbi:hypothetical protein EEB11_12040 [Pseudotabrizicola sediminis]|uniref:Uncharacterized protein n=1 Tax=Pseudotabrizicola sediminis TaxID=2486418 RepID=A0ABY2KKH2_9RHOB|nr:hypothetical protein [Pseudotabrizicola sediminis]TGD42990.1 hypothetical protein EEB11_12040 [Pseudotabrizicola sediminis]
MGTVFQADLSFLFDQPSVWRSLVQTLITITPLAIALSAYTTWRIGDRRGLVLMGGVALYLVWMLWPAPLAPALVLPGRVVSVIGWFWLVSSWGRQAKWHEPLLLITNSIVVTMLITLTLTTGVAVLRDLLGYDLPL